MAPVASEDLSVGYRQGKLPLCFQVLAFVRGISIGCSLPCIGVAFGFGPSSLSAFADLSYEGTLGVV